MRTRGAERPIQRVPSGLSGPGGIGFWPAAQGEFGGYHHGFRHLTTIWNRPSGVGDVFLPVATAPRLSGATWKRCLPTTRTSGRSKTFRTAVYASAGVMPPTATPPTVTPAAIRAAVVVVVLVVGSVPVTGSVPVVAVEFEARSAPIAPGALATTAVRPPPSRQPARAIAVRAGRLTAFEDSGA